MELNRRKKKLKILNSIKDGEFFIKRSKETIERLRFQEKCEYIDSEIEKIKKLVDERKEIVKYLHENLINLEKGLLDNILELEKEENIHRTKKILLSQKQRKIDQDKEKEENKKISKEYWDSVISESRKQRKQKYDIMSSYRYYNKICDSIPNYITNNLNEMPNNKGYIWRGIWLFGELEAENGPCIMFEKIKGNILVIHSYGKNEYIRYEKVGKNNKKLIYSRKLR